MKLLHLFLVLLIFSCTPPSEAQVSDDDEAGFAFVENVKGKNGNLSFLKTEAYKKTYQYKTAKEVYDKLVDARGDSRMRVPKFVMSDAERQVASAKPRSAVITLEMKAYEVCQSMGKDSLNAIAALLAHELTHYYEKHNWTNHFANNHRQSRTGMQLRNLDEGLRLETQADVEGGFLAYSAGYQSLDIMPKLLKAVYEQYRLPKNIKGYPSLEERTTFANKSVDKLKDLVVVYETAKYLTTVEMYEQAKANYEYILKDFQSREMYNNLGVVASLAAMNYMDGNDIKYGFPLELDAESRLGTNKRGKGFGVAEELLNQAVDYFEQANQMDKEYPISMLNLACANTLQSKFDVDKLEDAKFHARKAQKLSKGKKWAKTGTNVLVLQGIIADREGDKSEAATFFKKAERAGNSLASVNLKILNDEPFGEDMAARGFASRESIEGSSLDRVVAKHLQGRLELAQQFKIKKYECSYLTDDNSFFYIHVKDEYNYAYFQIAKPGYKGTSSKDIRYGDHFETVVKAHGNPDRSVELSSGRILVYYSSKILFELDDKSNVKTIGIFRMEQEASNMDDD